MESRESFLGFQRYLLALKRRWLPASAVFGSVVALTFFSLLLQKPVYVAEATLRFKKESTTSSLTGLGKEIGQLDPLQQQNTPLDTEAEVMRSVPVGSKTIKALSLKDKRGAPLKLRQFLKQLNVSNVKGTDVLQISYMDVNPQRAAAVVNTLIAVYLENNLRANRAEAIAAREFIQNQLPQAEAVMRSAEFALRRFKEENQVIALDEEAKSAVATLADLQRQTNATQTALTDATTASAELRQQLEMNLQQAKAATSLSQSPLVQDLLKQVQQVDTQLASERTRFQEDHPTIAVLKSKKVQLERLLELQVKDVLKGRQQPKSLQASQFEQNLTEELAKSEVRRLGLASQLAALAKLQTAYAQRTKVLPSLEQKQRELEANLEASRSTYALLRQKLQEIRIAENQNLGNARIVSSALVPDEPIGPRKTLHLVTGTLLASLLAISTAFVLENRDKSIRTVDEAKKLFGFTLLGMIPSFKKLERAPVDDQSLDRPIPEVVVQNSPRSSYSAAYRMLQANLKFLSSIDKQLKVIVVTSSVPKEGKSTVCANLAVAMAQLGRSVLLVDADMHRPFQERIWNLPSQPGLSNVIVGQTQLRATIQPVMVNLDVLTAGVMPPNPMALLDSQRMASLIEVFSASYDFTIIDTPALNVEADASILGRMADGVLLVVRPGVVDSASAAFAKAFLAQSGQQVLGQVINGVIPENEPHSYYYFSDKYYAQESHTGEGKLARERLSNQELDVNL